MTKIIAFILTFNLVLAQTPIRLTQGEYAPFDGVLMNDRDFIEASNSRRNLRLNNLRVQNMEEIIKTQETIIKNNSNKISQLELQKEKLQVDKRQSLILGYVIGTVSTILIAYTVTKK